MELEDAQQAHLFALAAAREDFAFFAARAFYELSGHKLLDNWHIGAITHQLDRIVRRKNTRLIVTMPPRSLKSFLISVAWPAWLFGQDPTTKIICASYAQTLSDDFAYQMRRLMNSPWYQSVFPITCIDPKRSSLEEIATTAGGYRFSTSTHGAMTGRGGDLIIIDDPMKANDAYSEVARENVKQWYLGTVSSRLNDPKKGAIVLVAQRLHEDDLPGHLLSTGGWHELCLPMEEWKNREVDMPKNMLLARPAGNLLHEARIGKKEIARLRREMGERDFEAQYNQRPMPPGGALFKLEWLERYDSPPPPQSIELIVQSWDTAYDIEEHHDYSVCTTWGISGQRYYLLDVFRKKLEFPHLQRAILRQRRIWKAGLVVIEKAGSGISLYQNIAGSNPNHWLKYLSPQKAKIDRASQQTPKFERGEIVVPRAAEWLDTFENEFLTFPHGKHDDQVDSVVQFLTAVDLRGIPWLKRAADIARRHH